jgi:hypothetical protein
VSVCVQFGMRYCWSNNRWKELYQWKACPSIQFIPFHFTIRYDRIHTISSLILIRREGMKKDSVELIHRERHDYEWLVVKCCDPMERIEGLWTHIVPEHKNQKSKMTTTDICIRINQIFCWVHTPSTLLLYFWVCLKDVPSPVVSSYCLVCGRHNETTNVLLWFRNDDETSCSLTKSRSRSERPRHTSRRTYACSLSFCRHYEEFPWVCSVCRRNVADKVHGFNVHHHLLLFYYVHTSKHVCRGGLVRIFSAVWICIIISHTVCTSGEREPRRS